MGDSGSSVPDPVVGSSKNGRMRAINGESKAKRPDISSPLLDRNGEEVRRRGNNKHVVAYDDLPQWRKHNPFIRNGYRINCESYQACLRSCLYLHNESLNIWSHGLGLLAFIAFWGVTYGHTLWEEDSTVSRNGRYVDALIFAPFLLGATLCLLMSTLYHTFEPCGKNISIRWAKADYIGITVLIWGSYFPVVHYLFWCRWNLQVIYLATITLLCIGVTLVSVLDVFAAANVHWYRAILFSSLGLAGLAPILHFTATHEIKGDVAHKLAYLFSMGLFYLVGAAFYATRIPERFCPGSCVTDMFLSSHFIFHLFILCGAVCHWMGSVYDFRHVDQCV